MDRPSTQRLYRASGGVRTKAVALTGSVGCGKSTLAAILERLGCDIWEADKAVHALEEAGGALCEDIRRRFGSSVMLPDGGVDRRALARRVFLDSSERTALEAIVHPKVRQRLRDWIAAGGGGTAGIKVAVIPLLLEVGWQTGWDAVLCVICPEAVQVKRLLERGWSEKEAYERIAAHWPQWRKAQAADAVFDAGKDCDSLERQAKRWLLTMRRELNERR